MKMNKARRTFFHSEELDLSRMIARGLNRRTPNMKKNAKVIAVIRQLALEEFGFADESRDDDFAEHRAMGKKFDEIADLMEADKPADAKDKMNELHEWDRVYLENSLLAGVHNDDE